MKCLEKDRGRRYETANGLTMDIQRYLADEPVAAGPPSASYRLRKFARRNKPQVIAAALVVLALLAGIAGTTWGLSARRSSQRDRAEQARQAEADRAAGERLAKLDAKAKQADAERQRNRAEAGEKLASERLVEVAASRRGKIAESVRDFLQNKLLGQADSRTQADALLRAGGDSAEAKENPTVRELLDRAAKELAPERIDANFPNQLLVQAEILQTVGNTYIGVGEYERAIGFLQRSDGLSRQQLGPDHPSTLVIISNLARAYQAAGKLELAIPLFEETLKLAKAKLRPRRSGHARRHGRPRWRVSGCRKAGPGPAAVRGDSEAHESEARPRPSRHARQHEQPRPRLSGGRRSRTWRCRSSRRR